MKELIDKSAVVAKIEEIYDRNRSNGYIDTCNEIDDILDFIDTLEVKEMQENSASEDLEEAIGQSFIYHENHGDDFRSDKQIETAYRYGFKTGVKYFFELGLKAQKGE